MHLSLTFGLSVSSSVSNVAQPTLQLGDGVWLSPLCAWSCSKRKTLPAHCHLQCSSTGYIRVDTTVSHPVPQHNVLHALCCFACCMPLQELLCWQVLYAYSHKLTQCRLWSTMLQINTQQWVAALYLQLFINLNGKGSRNGFERGI